MFVYDEKHVYTVYIHSAENREKSESASKNKFEKNH